MTISIITRTSKGQALTYTEADNNFINLRDGIDSTASSLGTSISALQAGQTAGSIGFTSYATMISDLAHPAGTTAILAADSTPTNDGSYVKTGASGSGSWVKSAWPNNPAWVNASSYSNFTIAVSSQGSNVRCLIVSTAMLLNANTTVPSTLTVNIVNGGSIDLSGFNLSFSTSPVISTDSQVFSGSGSVSGLIVSKPQWFGAAGDGVTLDTTAVQKAIDSTSKKIVIDRTFYIATLTMTGDNLILDMTNGGFKKYSASTSYMLEVSGANNTVTGGSWDGNRANVTASFTEFTASGVYVTGDYNTIVGNHFSSFKGAPIKADDSDYLIVEKNKITDTVGCGMILETQSSNVTGIKVLCNYLDTAIFIIGHSDGVSYKITNSEISNNTVDFTNMVYINSSGFNKAISFRGVQSKIHDNTIYCASKSSSVGVSAEFADSCSIVGNTVRNATLNCVELLGSQTFTIYNTVVSNNKLYAPGYKGVSLSGGPFNGLSITGNVFDNRTKLYLQTELGYGVTKNVSVAGNTFFSDSTVSYNPIDFYAIENCAISGNSFYIDSYQSTSYFIYLNRSQYITVTGNSVNNAQGILTLYSSATTAYNNIALSNNALISTSSTQMYLQGSASWGNACKAVGNSINSLNQYDILDAASNILTIANNSYSTPESYVSAGVGSTYKALYNGTLWYKHTGTGNTGWKQVTLA